MLCVSVVICVNNSNCLSVGQSSHLLQCFTQSQWINLSSNSLHYNLQYTVTQSLNDRAEIPAGHINACLRCLWRCFGSGIRYHRKVTCY